MLLTSMHALVCAQSSRGLPSLLTMTALSDTQAQRELTGNMYHAGELAPHKARQCLVYYGLEHSCL